MRDLYQQQENIFAQTMADRQEWEHATSASRRLAIAADAELRRRHPDQKIEPLRSAEPAPPSDTDRESSSPNAPDRTSVSTPPRTTAQRQHPANPALPSRHPAHLAPRLRICAS